MATQSLYRRYRPRRFGEVRGQDHVVRALRNAVAEGREGQAYLFSGPRGTGKTTSARILAKVLNCTDARDGEPCCECDSCLAVERGTSYDVHELDAASNNGVEAMRDLIEKASLGTPGRHKVYILDEVHMLTKPAEAALLKTLEEPPPHVVFVLATTDPQKMSDTIRSRTQHLQFHLLPADTLQEHVRWVAEDAGLTVTDAAIEQVLAQGGGSARDTLSALELVANSGGESSAAVPLDEFVEAMIDRDAGRALSMAARSVGLGRDPRTLTEELIGFLRNGFLSIMAPELVQLPTHRVDTLAELALRLGPAGLVRGIELLGEALADMRHAPDSRVLLDVAIVRLTADSASNDVAALAARIVKLEQQVAQGIPVATAGGGEAGEGAAGEGAAVPVDPATGRATLGGRARRTETSPAAAPAPQTSAPQTPAGDGAPVPAGPDEVTASRIAASESPVASVASSAATSMTRAVWEDSVRPALRGMARAVFAPAEYVSCSGTTLRLSLPNSVHRDKCEQHRSAVEKSLAQAVGSAVSLELVLQDDPGGTPAQTSSPDGTGGPGSSGPGSASHGQGSAGPTGTGTPGPSTGSNSGSSGAPSGGTTARAPEVPVSRDVQVIAEELVIADESVGAEVSLRVVDGPEAVIESPRRVAERRRVEAAAAGILSDENGHETPAVAVVELPEDDEIDLDDLIDAPPESVKTPIDRLAEAFPGSELLEESY